MALSTTPFLVLAIGGFWAWRTKIAEGKAIIPVRQTRAVYAWLLVLAAWGVTTSALAINGVYRSDAFLRLVPAFWIPMVPVAFSGALLLLWPTFRAALWTVTASIPVATFMAFQGIRVLAIGGIAKAVNGLLPSSFVYPVGIPDGLFGAVSLWMAWRAPQGGYSNRTVIAWNLAGIAVLMSAPVLMQLGLPGPLYLLDSQPDARTLLDFPMVLAPTLIVTMMFFFNALHALVTWHKDARSATA